MRTKDELSFPTGKARPHRLRAGEKKVGGERRVKIRPDKSHFRKIPRAFFLILLSALVASALYLLPSGLLGERVVRAASPASGTIATTGPVPPFAGTWTGTATGGRSANESTCVEGVNCDTFRLTVAPGDYTGKQIAIKIQWTVPTNDYDPYIHKCPTQASTNAQCNATAPAAQGQNGGAPGTFEAGAVDPGGVVVAGVDYTVHAVYFTVAPDQYNGSAALESKTTATRSATYVSAAINFIPSVAGKAPVAP